MATAVGSYVALGKTEFGRRKASVIASGVVGFVLTPIFVGVAGIAGLPGLASALVLLMWLVLLKNLPKLDWPGAILLGLGCTTIKYALVSWAGFTVLLTPWWQMLL